MSKRTYLTAEEAIAYLRLKSRRALYHLIKEHRLPFCRPAGVYLFDQEELDTWMHEHGRRAPLRKAS
jgi:excisionase family DNA binding protein